MQFTVATITIEGQSPLSHSRQHDEPRLEGESHEDYDKRTWMHKLNTATVNGKPTVIIPAHGMHQAIIAAAKYSKRQIPGQGKATWTAKFTSGIALIDNPVLNIDPGTVPNIAISANADGIRGSGKRVMRRFPMIAPGWKTTFDVHILDPIITESIFREMIDLAGMFIGIGRFRPEKGGQNGRFLVTKMQWNDQRKLAA